MDVDENPDTTIDASFCGIVTDPEIKCKLHQVRGNKCVAFDGINTRRRFYCCAKQGGVDSGVIQWVDCPWPIILQTCVKKLWAMFHDQNYGRVMDRHAYDKKMAKPEKQNEFLAKQFSELVDEVGQLFDWQDGKVRHMEHQNTTHHAEDAKIKLTALEEQCKMDLKMEKMRLTKE
nr:uncharacterized protein LOC109746710 [Aegilops tauschii subsp. strangulata]